MYFRELLDPLEEMDIKDPQENRLESYFLPFHLVHNNQYNYSRVTQDNLVNKDFPVLMVYQVLMDLQVFKELKEKLVHRYV